MSPWSSCERASNNALMVVYYFRDLDGLARFAQGEVHRKAWEWIVKAGHRHVGFFHEILSVPAEAYKSIYMNVQPTLMAAASVKCQGEDGED